MRLAEAAAISVLAAATPALASCGSGPTEAEILEQAHKMVKPQPGLYRSVTVLREFEMPGAQPREAGRMRERLGGIGAQEREFCLSPEDAEQGFARMLASSQDGTCAFSRFVVNDRRLSASLACDGEAGNSSAVEMDGTADERTSSMTLRIRQSGPGIAGGTLNMRLEVENFRIGDC